MYCARAKIRYSLSEKYQCYHQLPTHSLQPLAVLPNKNQTKKSQNQTFIRPYFHHKSDQKQTQNRCFWNKNQTFPILMIFVFIVDQIRSIFSKKVLSSNVSPLRSSFGASPPSLPSPQCPDHLCSFSNVSIQT